MKNLLKIATVSVMLLLITDSCTKNFDEINSNPNAPEVAPTTNVLINSIINTGSLFYGERIGMAYMGTYASHTSFRMLEASYEYRVSIVTGHWTTIYETMNDLNNVIKEAQNNDESNMQAVAIILKAFIAQKATDMWNAIPYSEALNGTEGIITPKYDTQQEIYYALIDELSEANSLLSKESFDKLGEGDILCNGNLEQWRKFGNSLRLRLALRISNIDPSKAETVINSILSNPTNSPILNSIDNNIILNWTGVSPYEEPWYVWSRNRTDYTICSVLVDTMKVYNDPRLPIYAQPAVDDGEYHGLVPGGSQTDFTVNNTSLIGSKFAWDPAGFSPFMRYSEVCFNLAEIYQRSLFSGDAQQAYMDGITASLNENGLSEADVASYLSESSVTWKGDYNEDLRKINMQKWIALFKQSSEAWAEVRRTDVPLLKDIPAYYSKSHNRTPFRYPYPEEELSLNSDNIAPHLVGITSDLYWGQQMWWDTRNDVN